MILQHRNKTGEMISWQVTEVLVRRKVVFYCVTMMACILIVVVFGRL